MLCYQTEMPDEEMPMPTFAICHGGMAVPNANGEVWDRLVGLAHCKGTMPKILNKYAPRKGIAQPQSQFAQSCVCEPFVYSHNRSAYSAAEK
jgi:hypothetical protein